MSNQTLRDLAKGYAKGAIDKDNYRSSRTELIQAIVASNIPVKAIDYEPPLEPTSEIEDAITEGIKRNETQITLPKQTTPKSNSTPPPVEQKINTRSDKKNRSPLVFILISIVIVSSLVLAVILFYPKPPESTSGKISTSDVSNTSNNVTTTEINVAAETLIADFLSERNWNKDSLDKFIESWSTLTEEQKNSVKSSKRMQRMKDSIYKQFLEGKALASIDSEKAQTKQQNLITFARTIGIEDSRLTLD